MNLFYKCVSFLPVKLIFVAMKEVVRVRKIAAGVHHAHHRYHHGWFIMMATGWVKGETRDICNAAGRTQPCGRAGGEVQGDHIPGHWAAGGLVAVVSWLQSIRAPRTQVFIQTCRMVVS